MILRRHLFPVSGIERGSVDYCRQLGEETVRRRRLD